MTMLEPKWAQSSTILERVPATSRPKDMEWSLAVEADVDVKQILFNNAILHRRYMCSSFGESTSALAGRSFHAIGSKINTDIRHETIVL